MPKKFRNCPACLKKIKILNNFKDKFEINYSFCFYCKSLFQNPIFKLTSNTNYDAKIKDPDGRIRYLKNEKKDKINNWYGETINYLNTSYKPGKILDFGAGLGFFLEGINRKWKKYALETSKSALQVLRSKKNLVVYNDVNQLLKTKKNYFDVIFFYHVIEHLHNPQEVLKKLTLLLKKNGTLIVGTPNINCIAFKLFKKNFRLLGPGHLCLFNEKSLRSIVESCGFKVFKKEFPFFKTKYFNLKNLFQLSQIHKISPPFYGSIMTIYAQKK